MAHPRAGVFHFENPALTCLPAATWKNPTQDSGFKTRHAHRIVRRLQSSKHISYLLSNSYKTISASATDLSLLRSLPGSGDPEG